MCVRSLCCATCAPSGLLFATSLMVGTASRRKTRRFGSASADSSTIGGSPGQRRRHVAIRRFRCRADCHTATIVRPTRPAVGRLDAHLAQAAEKIADRRNGNGSFWTSRGQTLAASLEKFRTEAPCPGCPPATSIGLKRNSASFNLANDYPLAWNTAASSAALQSGIRRRT